MSECVSERVSEVYLPPLTGLAQALGAEATGYTEAVLNTPAALLPDPLASPEGGSGQDAALRANLKMKRGGPQPDGILAALLGPDPVQKSVDRAGDRK